MKKALIKLSLLYGLIIVFNPLDKRSLAYISYLISLYVKEVKLSKNALKSIYGIMEDVERFSKEKNIKPDLSLIYNYLVLFAEDCLQANNITNVNSYRKDVIFNKLVNNSMKYFNSDLLEIEKVEEFNKEVNLIINKI